MDQVRRLRVLAAVAREGTFSAAGRSLGMAQSAVSQHVAALERDLEMTLVDRQSRPVQLTEAGRRLAEHGRVIASQLELAEQEVLELAGRRQPRLRLGAFPSALTTFVPGALRRFRRTRPEVALSLVDGHMPQLLRLLEEGEVDLALLYGHEDVPDAMSDQVRLDHLRDDTFRIVLPCGHRLADRPSLRLSELADEPWVGSRSGANWFRIVVEACRADGFTPKVALATDDYLGLQAMVASTLGVGAIPGLAVRRSPQVVSLPIEGRSVIRRIWAGRTSAHAPSPIADEIVVLLRDAATRWP